MWPALFQARATPGNTPPRARTIASTEILRIRSSLQMRLVTERRPPAAEAAPGDQAGHNGSIARVPECSVRDVWSGLLENSGGDTRESLWSTNPCAFFFQTGRKKPRKLIAGRTGTRSGRTP